MYTQSIHESSVRLRLGVAVLCLTVLFTAAQASARPLRLLSAWPENMAFVEGCLGTFEKNLAETSGGALTIQFSGPDVVPTVEQFQPVQSGVFDMLFTIAPYHMGTTAVGAAVDAIDPDPERRRESGVFDFVDRHYRESGMKLVAIVPVADMNFLSRVPVAEKSPSFQGLKLRTIQTVAPLVTSLGGAPVNLPAGEVYTALQKGVIDGAVVITYGAKELKWHEVTKYMVRPTFGQVSTFFFMNLEKYEALTPEERAMIDRAGARTERDAVDYFRSHKQEEFGYLKGQGLQETQMAPEDAARIENIFRDTVWTIAKEKSGAPVRELRELARSQGLTQ